MEIALWTLAFVSAAGSVMGFIGYGGWPSAEMMPAAKARAHSNKAISEPPVVGSSELGGAHV